MLHSSSPPRVENVSLHTRANSVSTVCMHSPQFARGEKAWCWRMRRNHIISESSRLPPTVDIWYDSVLDKIAWPNEIPIHSLLILVRIAKSSYLLYMWIHLRTTTVLEIEFYMYKFYRHQSQWCIRIHGDLKRHCINAVTAGRGLQAMKRPCAVNHFQK